MNDKILISSHLKLILIGIFIIAAGLVLNFGPVQAAIFETQVSNQTNTVLNECGLITTPFSSCRDVEEMILASTLRIEIDTSIIHIEGEGYYGSLHSNGHGTVMNGRYLLTHNHFTVPLNKLLADEFEGQFATVRLYTASGSLLWQGALTTAAVAYEDAEMLLLEFQHRDGDGLFDVMNIPSAKFSAREISTVTPGEVMAQVNWDGNTAFVQWTEVKEAFYVEGVTPTLKLADCILGGSSGGGVFVHGEHIANNWSHANACLEETNDQSRLHSKAALNSSDLLALSQSSD